MKIDCSFEIRGGSIGIYELKDLFDLLHKYIPEIPADPRKIGSNENSSEKDRTINELNELLERHRKDAEKSSKKIDSLDEELKEAKEFVDNVPQSITGSYDMINNLKEKLLEDGAITTLHRLGE